MTDWKNFLGGFFSDPARPADAPAVDPTPGQPQGQGSDVAVASAPGAVHSAPTGASPPVADPDDQKRQVRQLIKQALESPTAEGLTEFLDFTSRFRRLAVWNARMAYIQRPGARVIASEYEWRRAGRYVVPDAVPIIILWPFAPIRFVYELADTGPPIDRGDLKDPFAAKGEIKQGCLSKLEANLKKQKTFKITIELRRQGFSYAGSAAAQGSLPIAGGGPDFTGQKRLGEFASANAQSSHSTHGKVPGFRVTINDRLELNERFVTIAHELGHIFCGHLGGCMSSNRDDDESGWPDRHDLGLGEEEIEAEAVAYLVSARAGIATASASYMKPHAEKADMKKVNVDLIVRAASRIERMANIHYGTMLFKAPS